MKTKTLAVTAVALGTFALAGIYGVGVIKAETAENGRDTIVQKIADKFKLNKDEVKAVFDENRAERQGKMEERFEANLNKAVESGKITEAQKSAILTKHKEIQAKRDGLKDLPQEERHDAMQKIHEEMENWAKDNGIDMSQIAGPRGEGHHGGNFGPRL
ncbi:MAG: hypothetical protein Q7S53_02270 [bacterium]|nr:hypothetical protein [bacterium]